MYVKNHSKTESSYGVKPLNLINLRHTFKTTTVYFINLQRMITVVKTVTELETSSRLLLEHQPIYTPTIHHTVKFHYNNAVLDSSI